MDEQKKILQCISQYKRFLVTTHHNPDADAVSSSLAIAAFLKSKGKEVKVVNEDALPQWLKFLPQSSSFKKAKTLKLRDYDVAIMLDCGDIERIGGVHKLLIAGKPIINIDHHISNTHFGSINWVDSTSSSTCEMVYSLLQKARFKVTPAVAKLFYAGIMTDTGSFRYDNVSAKTHAIIAALMPHKINAQDMYSRLYPGIPVADMKLFSKVLHEAQLLLNDKVYVVMLNAGQSQIFSKDFDVKDRLFGFLRSVQGIEVVVILTQINSKEVRLNFRSQGKVDVARLAGKFNGGGHPKAAGGKMRGTLSEVKLAVLKAIKKGDGYLF